jgi:hypothetical protein
MTKRIQISTPFGDVTESARRRAAMNMREDPALFAEILADLTRLFGGDEAKGKSEMLRRYPEAFGDTN